MFFHPSPSKKKLVAAEGDPHVGRPDCREPCVANLARGPCFSIPLHVRKSQLLRRETPTTALRVGMFEGLFLGMFEGLLHEAGGVTENFCAGRNAGMVTAACVRKKLYTSSTLHLASHC